MGRANDVLCCLTNNFLLPALLITQLYRCRWQVELFFRWIKQHLRIKAFYGTSQNAVKTQIWIAITVSRAGGDRQATSEFAAQSAIDAADLSVRSREMSDYEASVKINDPFITQLILQLH